MSDSSTPSPPASLARTCSCGRGRPEPAAGHSIVSQDVNEGWSTILVHCSSCDRRWSVLEDTGYHVPQYTWTPA